MRSAGRPVFAAIFLLLSSACADGQVPAFLSSALEQLPFRIDRPEQLEEALHSRQPPPDRGPASVELPRAKPAVTANRPLPEVAPSALVGLPARRIAYWMGPPTAVWQENGHAMWRYVSAGCVVMLFVDQEETVRHVTIGRRDHLGADTCARAISDHIGNVDVPVG